MDYKISCLEEYSQVNFVHVLLQLSFISRCEAAAVARMSLIVVLFLNVPSQVAPGCARMVTLGTVVPHPIMNRLLVDFHRKQTWNFRPVPAQVTDTQLNIGLCLLLPVDNSFLGVFVVSRLQVPLKMELAATSSLALFTRVENTPVICCIVIDQVCLGLGLVETGVTKQTTVVLSYVSFQE